MYDDLFNKPIGEVKMFDDLYKVQRESSTSKVILNNA